MAWTVFTGKGRKGDYLFPVATIHRAGTMALNQPLMDALGNPATLDLLFDDQDPLLIGLRASNRGAYRPRRTSDERTWLVSAASFLRYIGYAPRETQRFKAEESGGSTISFRLDAPLPKGPKARSKSDGGG
jgi:hypothetical protein